jgi:hypothetical protein
LEEIIIVMKNRFLFKNIAILLVSSYFIACNSAKENAQDALTNQMEKAIEAKTGNKVDLGTADSYENNNGSISFVSEGQTFVKTNEKFQATVVFQKDKEGLAMSFQFTGEEGKSLLVIVNHIPEDFTIPLTGKFAVSNSYDGVNPVATMILMQTNESGVLNSPMPFEGTLTVNKLTESEITFDVDAKGGNAVDAESPSTWKSIKVSGTMKSPIIQTSGIDKNTVLK